MTVLEQAESITAKPNVSFSNVGILLKFKFSIEKDWSQKESMFLTSLLKSVT